MPALIKSMSHSLEQPSIIFESTQKGHGFYSNSVHLLGFCYDGTACFRKGASKGPNAIRDISYGIESYSPYLDSDIESCDVFDLGNLKISKSLDVDEQWLEMSECLFDMLGTTDLLTNNIKLLTLGGEHSISFSPIKAYLAQYSDLLLIHLDAHADLRDGYEGHHYSHASIIYRVQEYFKEGHQLIQYGIRSGTKEEFLWMKEHETLSFSLEDFLYKIKSIPNNRPIYLTLDLDYFDPSFFPGTGTPEPGGEDFHSFIKLLKVLLNKNLVGCDVVELAPGIDPTGNSSVFAAKIVRELILCLSNNDPRKIS